MTETAAPPLRPDWGLVAHRSAGGQTLFLVLAVAAILGLAGIVAATAGPLAGLVPAIVGAGGLWWWIGAQGRGALRAAGARLIPTGAEPRLGNVVAGLAADLRIAVPDIYLVSGGGPNALVVAGRHPRVAFTEAILRSFTRTEIEAVVAHCLARLASGDALKDELAIAAFGVGATRIGAVEDVRAAAITRYPPALAAAVTKAEPRPGRYARLWFVGDDRSHESADVRARRLNDL